MSPVAAGPTGDFTALEIARGRAFHHASRRPWLLARLVALLESHGIEWRSQPEPVYEPLRLSTDEKIALFRRLFRGRADVYPIRWES